MKKLLILGIDPGTTRGYVLLDLDGNLVLLKSSRTVDLSHLVFDVLQYGTVLAVVSDVSPSPSFVKEIAKRLGARLIYPPQSLLIKEKAHILRRWRRDFFEDKELKLKNKHEKDAMASAVYGLRRLRPLLLKIDHVLEEKRHQECAEKVKELLITGKEQALHRALVTVILEKEGVLK